MRSQSHVEKKCTVPQHKHLQTQFGMQRYSQNLLIPSQKYTGLRNRYTEKKQKYTLLRKSMGKAPTKPLSALVQMLPFPLPEGPSNVQMLCFKDLAVLCLKNE